MEPYSMPQLDNSDTQYEGDDISNPRASSSNVKKQYTGVTGEPLPLLSSSAWSAVIHRPAEEDSEPDDLPSTVDMDAIKGSPATPLATTAKRTPSECWSSEGERAELRGGNGGDGSDSDGSDEDSDSSDDSASSASDSGSESGSCTWSDSDSASTSCSSRSRGSSQSSRVHQTFSIRETNFDQGGLKLKFSALKTPKKITSKESASQPVEVDMEAKDVDGDKVKTDREDSQDDLQLPQAKHDKLPVCADLKVESIKDEEEGEKVDEAQKEVQSTSKVEKMQSPSSRGLKGVRKQVPTDLKAGKEHGSTSPSKAVKASNQVSGVGKADKVHVPSSSKVDKSQNQMPAPQKPAKNQTSVDKSSSIQIASKAEESLPLKRSKSGEGPHVVASVATKASGRGAGRPVKGAAIVSRVGSKAETRSDTRKADTRRKELTTTRSRDKVSSASGGRGISNMRVPGNPPPPYANTGSPRGGGNAPRAATPSGHTVGDGVAQLLATAEQESISVSEHLQVINQEDLAAILPDVVAPDHHDGEACGPFDGFEDVSSESGKAAARGGAESSSDVELPEQVVSAAIERIHLDGGRDSSSDGASCDEEAEPTVGQPYASSLLQQFVEKTEMLSSQVFEKTNGVPKRRKRGRPPKASKSKRAPELEAYMRLDCSVSNVSPDSGIQSVAGSPIRRSVSPVMAPSNPIHSPENSKSPLPIYNTEENCATKSKPSLLEVRRRPGRPKGSGKKMKGVTNADFASGTDSCDEVTPAPCLGAVVKRGPGRPKKMPPVLEPVAPIVDKYFEKLGTREIESDSVHSIKKDSVHNEKLVKSDSKPNPKKKSCDILKIVEKSFDVSKTDESLAAIKQPKSSAILSEICERVSKRLDLPIHSVTSYPLKLSKVKLAKDFPHDDKLKKYKKKKELGEGSEKEASDKRSRRFSSSSPGSSNRGSGSGARNQLNNSAKPTPAPRLPPPRLLSLPPGIPHKHKKKKKKSKPLKTVRLPEDPTLLSDLERLVHMFRRSCTITIAKSSLHRSEASLPSIFRVKRIGKKRKGSDKSRNTQATSLSDRESGPEGDGKEKSRQRRPKKSAVEPPKGHHERSEPATNEQRLPLKKRHYHMSLPQAPSTSQEVPAVDKAPSSDKISANKLSPSDGPRKSISSDRSVEKTSEKTSSKPEKNSTNTKSGQIEVKAKPISESSRNSRNSITLERGEKNSEKSVTKPDQKPASKSTLVDTKTKPTPEVPRKVSTVENIRKTVTSEKSTEKISDKILSKLDKNVCNKNSQVETTKAKPISDVPRNSIDEAIEACINRYTTTARPTVITTPKKRHRLENTVSTSPRLPPPSVCKTKDTDASVNNNNKTTVANSPLPSKRSTSRSSSANAATTNSPPPPPPPTLETKPMDGIFEPSSRTADLDLPPTLPNTMSRTVLSNKPISPNAKVNTLNILNSLAASSATVGASNSSSTVSPNANSKSTPPVNKSAPPTHKSATNSSTSRSGSKLSTLPIEQNSVKTGATPNSKIASSKPKPCSGQSPIKTNSVKLPSTNKPNVEVVSDIASESTISHNLRLKRPNTSTPEETSVKRVPHKKKKLMCDVRVRVKKLTPTEEILVKNVTDLKPKIKRRKAINRTGFPVKKKKKKKIVPETVQVFEDCEDLIPKSIIRHNAVINNKTVISTSETVKESDTQPKHPSAKPETLKKNKTLDAVEGNANESTALGEKCKDTESERSRTEGDEDADARPMSERTRKRKRESDTKALFPLLLRRFRGARKDEDTDSVASDVESGPRKKQPRWRKKFLVAGLFSDYYKEDEPRTGDAGKSRLAYKPEEHRHGLLPPPYHCGKYLRQRRVEFKLPYDMWWQHTHNQLPGRDLVPSWNYKKIRTNVYYDMRPQYSYEAQACNCTPVRTPGKKGCGEDCINRMVYSECSSQLCPCKECCCNQRIQRHEWAPGLEKFMTKDKGWGVKTKQVIKSGEFILEYVGEVVSEKEFKDRMASRYMSDTHHYCLNLDGGLVIDGHRMGGDGRFVNHSCEPNCEMQKWSVNGLFRMALFALRDIRPDEELSYDYNFSLFNPAEGQPCKCGSEHCRGVIGGKSQRVNGSTVSDGKAERRIVGRPRKNARKNTVSIRQSQSKKRVGDVNGKTPVKPMSHQQRCFAQIHHCFLLRNLEKVKRLRERLKEACLREQPSTSAATNSCPRPLVKQSDVFMAQLNALSSPRNIRTRRLAQAEDNPELTKTARLAYVFRDLYNTVIAAKDEQGEMLAAPFLTLPTKRKLPAYFQRVTDPIDLGSLEHNIVTGLYRTVEAFDADMTRLFTNNVRFFGRTSDLGIVATRLRKVYNIAKLNCLAQLEEILGEAPPPSFIPELNPADEEEDVIRCICGLYRDEGTMIQCERCLVWQHCDCVRADQGIERYLCERCDGRKVDLEVRLEAVPSYATPGHEYYVTLLRGQLQLRQGDTVYVLRDMDVEGTPASQPPVKVTYKTVKAIKYTDLDIFRIERLWKDEKGDRFAFGHHFLRPHETFHEPSRKFFPNEVMRVPLYEVVPVELIMGQCWVLDVSTFYKGRPVNAPEEHVYVCEYRVDKTAHLFTKIARPRYPICTKSYAFEMFDTKVKPVRTYTPHGQMQLPTSRSRGVRTPASREQPPEESIAPTQSAEDEEEHIPLARVREALANQRANQKVRLNSILLRLLARLPSKQPLDVSYLLEPGRRHRKKTSLLNT